MNIGFKKNAIKSIALIVVSLVIYNVIFLMIPFSHTGTFKVAYGFGIVAIVAQVFVILLAMSGANIVRKKFYAYPIVRMGMIYLAVQMVLTLFFSLITTFVENVPSWIAIVVCSIVLCTFIVLILLTDTARDEVEKIEENEERQTVQIKTFRINVDSLVRRAEDQELLKKLEQLSDIARYSDPVSNEVLYAVENEITEKINELGRAIRKGEIENAKSLAMDAIDLFEDRNAQCKAFKSK